MGHTADVCNYTAEQNIHTGILLCKNTSETLLRLVAIISLKILPVSGKRRELRSTCLSKARQVELSVRAPREFQLPRVRGAPLWQPVLARAGPRCSPVARAALPASGASRLLHPSACGGLSLSVSSSGGAQKLFVLFICLHC